MMFGRLHEAQNEGSDSQLIEIEKELRNKIDKAKNLANSLQSTSDSDEMSLITNGVTNNFYRN